MKNPMNDDDYLSNDEQIQDLKDLVNRLASAMAAAVADLSSEARGSQAIVSQLLDTLDDIDPSRELLREHDPENPLCDDAPVTQSVRM